MRRGISVLIAALILFGPAVRPAAAVGADHLFFSINPVASVKAGTLFNVQVQARDSSSGNVVDAGFTGDVVLTAAAVGGSDFTAGNVVAATAGVADFTVFLNNAADTYQITASATGLTDALSSTFNVTASHLVIATVLATQEAGTPFSVVVAARDADNALAENFSGTVTLDANAPAGGSNFVGGTKNATAVAGSATFTGLVLNDAADGYTVSASSTGLTGGVSNTFNVTATIIAADHLFFSINPVASVKAGTLFNVQVQARDSSSGNVVDAGFTGDVVLTAAAVGGSDFTAGNVVAATAGVADFTVFLNNAADTYQITASATGLTDALSSTFNVTASHLVIATVLATQEAGTPFSVVVAARDADNALAENFSGTVTLDANAPAGGSNFVGGTKNATAVAGSATFTGLVLNDAANGYTVTASAAGLNNGVSNTFNVTATIIAADHLFFSINPVASVKAGTLFNVQVQARDSSSGNVVDAGFTGDVVLTAAAVGGSDFTAGNVVAATAGVADFTVFLNNAADTYQITASATGLTDALSSTFNVTASHLVIATVLATQEAGTPFSVVVAARDADNALAENFSGTVNLDANAPAGGSNFVGGTKNATAVAGSATFTGLVLNNAANGYTVTASAAGLNNGVSNAFNVTATHLAILAISNVRAGDAFNVTVEARDANNNRAENYTANVMLDAAATGGSNFNGGSANVAAVGGSANFVGLVLSNAADDYTVTAASPGLTSGVSNAFDVTAHHLVITTVLANHQAGTPFTVTVEARDDNNVVAENFSGNVNLDAAAAAGGSNFNGGTRTVAAVAGSATFTGLVLNNAANGYTVTASAAGLNNGVSNAFNVTATHLAILAISNVRAGDAFNVTVEARDANNNRAENYTANVMLDAAATGGSNFNGGSANVAAVGGSANFVGLVLSNAADDYTVTAASPGLTSGVSNAFDVTAHHLVITTVLANHQAGTPFTVTVEARDDNNVVAENFSGNVNLDAAAAAGGSNFNGGTRTVAAVAGSATFTGLVLNNAANGYTVTASAAGLNNGVSNAFNVTATHLAILAISNVRAGDAFNVTVEARDANNNRAENYTANVMLDAAATGGSNFNGGSANVAAVGGSANFVGLVLSNAADDYTVTAASPGLTSGVSNAFDVTAHHLVITTVLANHQAGTPFTVTVEARDDNNVVAENFSGNVNLDAAAAAGGSNFNGGTRTVAAVAGSATFTGLVLNNAANGYTVTASAAGLNNGVSNAFNVTERAEVSINDVSITEGNFGTRSATFTVTLSRPSTVVATVQYATAGASATSGVDFVAAAGTLTFAAGQTSKTITVLVKGDLLNEADETFVVNLSGAVNALLVDPQGTGTIRNDDLAPPIIALPVVALEGSTVPRSAIVTVRLGAPSGQEVRVAYQTADGTAVDGVGEAGIDYTATNGTLVFAPGETERTVTVALRNDLVVEADEFFFVDLLTPVNATILTPRTRVWILDDDAPVRQLAALRAQVLALPLDPIRKLILLANARLDCSSLREFTRDVARFRGPFIAPADADALIAAANRLRVDIGCHP